MFAGNLRLALHAFWQVRLDGSQYRLEALDVACNDVAFVEEVVATVEVAHQATGFLDQQYARCHVPFGQARLPEGVEAASSHVGQVQAGGAGAADAAWVWPVKARNMPR